MSMDLESLISNSDEDGYIQEQEETDINIIETTDIDNLLNANINYNNRSLQIDSILKSLTDGYYVIPRFQRRYVWNKEKVAYLALSIIKNIPIPPLYLYLDQATRQQYVLDGQQRLISIFLYFNDLAYSRSDNAINFGEVARLNDKLRALEKEKSVLEGEQKTSQKIKELNKEMKKIRNILDKEHGMKRCSYVVGITEKGSNEKKDLDISYSKFEKKSRDYLLRQALEITLVECRDENPQKIYAYIFKLLNSAGKILGSQEIRNGVYWRTNLYDRLYELNTNNQVWRKIYGKISIYSKDIEILLKALALAHFSKVVENEIGEKVIQIDYLGFTWKKIMDAYSELGFLDKLNQEIDKMEQFLNHIELCEESGEKLKCKKAVFEAVFVGFSLLNTENPREIDYKWLCNAGEDFGEILSSKGNVEDRLTIAYHKVREYINA